MGKSTSKARSASRRPASRRRRGGGRRKHLRRGILMACALALLAGGGYVGWLDHRVTSAFEGKRWSLPARVFARPLELFPDRRLSPANLVRELRAAGYNEAGQVDDPGDFRRTGRVVHLHTRAFRFADGREPAKSLSVRFDGERIEQVRDRNTGSAVPLVRVDPAHLGNIHPHHNEDRDLVRLSRDVPRSLVEALIATEDQGFAEHMGVSLVGIARAAWANLRAGRVVQGGSTLTQQLVKNFYLSSERTLARKVNEAIMAVLLELRYDKPAILEAYLNEVYLGQDGRRAIHGFGLASRFYFGRSLKRLDLGQQALLVGLVKGPSQYNPRRHPERARRRRATVLGAMADQGYLDPERARALAERPLGISERPPGPDVPYPGFMDLVRRHLQRDYDEEALTTQGLRVFTTLAPHVQHAAESAVARRARAWSDEVEAAVVSVSVDDGEVEAVVGGRRARYDGFNRALDARRPVGSLIKPAVYLAALSRSGQYGLGTPIEDRAVTLRNEAGERWQPGNYDGEYLGRIPLWRGLADSRNAATVRLGLDIGLRAVVDAIERLGGRVPDTVYPSLLLGAVEYTPLEVAGVYETLATGGFRTPLRSVRAVMTPEGRVLSRYALEVERTVDAAPAYLVNHALERVVRNGTARGLSRWLPSGLRVAGKTGTTNDRRDSWFAGFTGDRLAVAWVGRDDNGRTGLTGSSGAMTVWGELVDRLPAHSRQATPPPSVAPVPIAGATGLLGGEGCGEVTQLPYIRGTAPTERAACAAERDPRGWFGGW